MLVILRLLLALLLEDGGERVPRMAYEYAKRISRLTGAPLHEVLRSEPVRRYIERLREEVLVDQPS